VGKEGGGKERKKKVKLEKNSLSEDKKKGFYNLTKFQQE